MAELRGRHRRDRGGRLRAMRRGSWRADVVRAVRSRAALEVDGRARRVVPPRQRRARSASTAGSTPAPLELMRDGDGLAVVNELPLEEYLVGRAAGGEPTSGGRRKRCAPRPSSPARTRRYHRLLNAAKPYHIVASTAHQQYAGRVPQGSPVWTRCGRRRVRSFAGRARCSRPSITRRAAATRRTRGGVRGAQHARAAARGLPVLGAGSPHFYWTLDLRLADLVERSCARRRRRGRRPRRRGDRAHAVAARVTVVTVRGTAGTQRLRGNDFRRMRRVRHAQEHAVRRGRRRRAWRASPGAATATAWGCASGAPRAWPSRATGRARSSSSTTPAPRSDRCRADRWRSPGPSSRRSTCASAWSIEAQAFPEARRPAYGCWIDFGPLGVKRSSAQITDALPPRGPRRPPRDGRGQLPAQADRAVRVRGARARRLRRRGRGRPPASRASGGARARRSAEARRYTSESWILPSSTTTCPPPRSRRRRRSHGSRRDCCVIDRAARRARRSRVRDLPDAAASRRLRRRQRLSRDSGPRARGGRRRAAASSCCSSSRWRPGAGGRSCVRVAALAPGVELRAGGEGGARLRVMRGRRRTAAVSSSASTAPSTSSCGRTVCRRCRRTSTATPSPAPRTPSGTRRCSRARRARSPRRRRAALHARRCSHACARGASRSSALTLHVGPGTFRPIRTARVEDHVVCRRAGRRSPRDDRGRGERGACRGPARGRRGHDGDARARERRERRRARAARSTAGRAHDPSPATASASSTRCSRTSTCRARRCLSLVCGLRRPRAGPRRLPPRRRGAATVSTRYGDATLIV